MNKESDKEYRRAFFRCWLIGMKDLRGVDPLRNGDPWHVLRMENYFVENTSIPLSDLSKQPNLYEYAVKHVNFYLKQYE